MPMSLARLLAWERTRLPEFASRALAAQRGAFVLTGQPAALSRGVVLVAAQGSYSLAGQAAALSRGLRLVAGHGAFELTGQDADLQAPTISLEAAAGSFVLTGQAATLRKTAHVLDAAAGSYALTGQDVTLTVSGGITDPTDIANLVFWYDVTLSTITEDAFGVTQVDDLSGNANHATKGFGTAAFSADAFGPGLDGINVTSDEFDAGAVTIPDAGTFFFVGQVVTSIDNGGHWMGRGCTGNNDDGATLRSLDANGNIQMIIGNGVARANSTVAAALVVDTTFAAIGRWDGSTVDLNVDGTDATQGSHSLGTLGGEGIGWPASPVGSAGIENGLIGVGGHYSRRLTDQEVSDLMTYLTDRYGIGGEGAGSPSGDDTFQAFDDFSGPVVQTFDGDQGYDTFAIANSDAVTLTPESRIDARGSTWRQPPPPTTIFQCNMGGNFTNPPDNSICWVGALWLGEAAPDATYDDVKPGGSKGLMINSHGGIIDGVRLHNVHEDAITVSHGEHAAREPHVMSYIRNCWVTLTLGDAIENDHIANLTIDDVMLDEVYVPVSVDPGGQYNGSGEESANLLVVTNCLFRTRSAGSEGNANYFGWVKTRNQGPQTCPNTEMHNCLLAFDGWATTFAADTGPPGRWGLFLERLQAASNNRVLWLLDTDPPWISHPASWPTLPSGFIRETGAAARTTWEAAKQNWIDSHPDIAHAPGDPVSNPANADPNSYGGGG